MELSEWLAAYIKYKDSIQRKIEKIEVVDKSTVLLMKKDGTQEKAICTEDLSTLAAESLPETRIACLNRKSNLDWLIANWDKVKDKKITFIFVNLQKAESWSVNTLMHHNVTEKAALKTGLMSLFSTVPEVN